MTGTWVIVAGLLACPLDVTVPTLQPVADARAQGLADALGVTTRLAGAVAGLTVDVCELGANAWVELDGDVLEAPGEIAANVGIEAPGVVDVTWTAVPATGTEPARNEVDLVEVVWVANPGALSTALSLTLRAPGGDATWEVVEDGATTPVEVRVVADQCAAGPQVTVDWQAADGSRLQVPVPLTPDDVTAAGPAEAEPASWLRGSQFPQAGGFQYTNGASGASQVRVESDDAGGIAAGAWPVTVWQADWEARAVVPLEP